MKKCLRIGEKLKQSFKIPYLCTQFKKNKIMLVLFNFYAGNITSCTSKNISRKSNLNTTTTHGIQFITKKQFSFVQYVQIFHFHDLFYLPTILRPTLLEENISHENIFQVRMIC